MSTSLFRSIKQTVTECVKTRIKRGILCRIWGFSAVDVGLFQTILADPLSKAAKKSIKMKVLHAVILIFYFTFCESANILYVMPFTAKSHYIGMKNLALELARRGHEVFVITPHREDEYPATYHQLMVSNVSFWTKLFDVPKRVFDMIDIPFESSQLLLYKSGFMVNELVFDSTDVQQFLEQNHKIDLVVTEIFFNEGMYMFAHKFQAPLVLVTTVGNSFKGNFYMGNPLQLSTVYHEYGSVKDPLSFLGRLYNVYICAFDVFMLKFWYFPRQQESILSYFKDLPQPVPSLEDIAANAALVLLNSHFSMDTPTAYLPNVVEVGGMHIKDTNDTLPLDLQRILDNAHDGVVLLSFGSNVLTSELDEEKLLAFLTVFGELKQTVLMKWEGEAIGNLPSNVVLREWFPQKAVVAHPNVKLFIGHGGLLGLQETVVAGVPILGIPVYGDQYLNILDTVRRGHGELLEYKDISESILREKLHKLLNDGSYMENAMKLAYRFRDRPMKPLDTAVWWTEYVLRHKGGGFMKPLKMSYIAYQNLDVYLFLISLLVLCLYGIVKSVNFVRNVLRRQTKKQKKD